MWNIRSPWFVLISTCVLLSIHLCSSFLQNRENRNTPANRSGGNFSNPSRGFIAKGGSRGNSSFNPRRAHRNKKFKLDKKDISLTNHTAQQAYNAHDTTYSFNSSAFSPRHHSDQTLSGGFFLDEFEAVT
ncbi:unnamed protein product, partial [Meganyctiphanes norvegica]